MTTNQRSVCRSLAKKPHITQHHPRPNLTRSLLRCCHLHFSFTYLLSTTHNESTIQNAASTCTSILTFYDGLAEVRRERNFEFVIGRFARFQVGAVSKGIVYTIGECTIDERQCPNRRFRVRVAPRSRTRSIAVVVRTTCTTDAPKDDTTDNASIGLLGKHDLRSN